MTYLLNLSIENINVYVKYVLIWNNEITNFVIKKYNITTKYYIATTTVLLTITNTKTTTTTTTKATNIATTITTNIHPALPSQPPLPTRQQLYGRHFDNHRSITTMTTTNIYVILWHWNCVEKNFKLLSLECLNCYT